MADNPERVKIWNSFFGLAWSAAKEAHEADIGRICRDVFEPAGGTLPPALHHSLATITLCNLAIEARVNHLLEELIEERKVSEDIGRAVRWLPTKEKWFLLPALTGKSLTLSAAAMPHQAIAAICDFRNDLVHVNFDKLAKLPTGRLLQSYFENFVKAMEDMNVILERGRPHGPIQEVIDMGRFTECD